MKKKSDFLFIWILALVIFGLTQVEFYSLTRELKVLKATPLAQQALTATSTKQNTAMEKTAKPGESFYTEGTSIIHETASGTKETVISDFPKKMEVGLDGGIDIIAHSDLNTAIVAPSCWEGNGMRKLYRIDAAKKTLSVMKSQAPCFSYVEPENGDQLSQYLVYPGLEADRFIKVDLIEDTSAEVGILPKPYTYARNGDESGYSAFITGDVTWSVDGFNAEVYDGGVPLDIYDYRLPIMMKSIH